MPQALGVATLHIEPGGRWQNGYGESFHSCLRDESLIVNLFYTLDETRRILEDWRICYNQAKSYRSL